MTDKHTFEGEPNIPPVILSKPGQPEIGSIVWIDKVELPEWRLQVWVRDENTDEVLLAHSRVRPPGDMLPTFVPQDVMRSNEPLRDLEVVVNTTNLINFRCHRLELAVSGSFPGYTDPEFFGRALPGNDEDVARAWWTIWEGQGQNTTPDQLGEIAGSCRTIDLVAAETLEPMP